MRVLVIEDEEKLAGIVARSLRDEGFAADIALDGERGLGLALSHPYDAIILDIMLPGKAELRCCTASALPIKKCLLSCLPRAMR